MLGGFAEVSDKGLTVLADLADSVEDFDRACWPQHIGEIEQHIEKTEPGSELDKLIAGSITSRMSTGT